MRWIRRTFQKSRTESELDKELRFHLEQQIASYIAAGITPEEARRRANLEFGGLERVKEEVRDTRWETHLDNLFRDIRYAFRTLRKDRRFALIAIFALALGIGATTVVFSVAYNVFFHALPYKNFDRSVVIYRQTFETANPRTLPSWFSPAEIRAFREHNQVFEDMIAYTFSRPTYNDGKSIRYFPGGAEVTTNAFEYLGVQPLLGRTFSKEDGRPEGPLVFVINYQLWQRQFGGDPKILGKTLILNGKPTTLIGIMPQQFNAFAWGINVFGENFWRPITRDRLASGSFQLMARLKPGVSVETARRDLDAIAHRMHKPNPGRFFPEQTFPEDKFAIVPETLLDSLIGDFKKTLYALLAAVFFLLLIACSNVANLLLARATAREREIAMRAALGATRGRLIRQLLVESFVLAVAACGTGCGLAFFGLKSVVALIPAGVLPDETVICMNAPVLFLSLGVTVLTTILCGVAPALHVARSDLQLRLTGTSKGVGGSFRHGTFRAGLVVSEVALSIILLIGAGLLMRSFLALTRVDLGFDAKNVLYFELNLPPAYNTDVPGSLEKKNLLTRQLLDRLQTLPGVLSAAEFNEPPPLKYESSDTIIPGKPHTERWDTRFDLCSEGYFRTMGLPLIRGRLFSADDVTAARDVMVVNETFSRKYFPNEDPLGHKVKLQYLDSSFLDGPHDTYFEIIGIVRDYKTRGYESPSWQTFPEAFAPYSVAGYHWRTFMARTAVDPKSLLANMGREVRALDPGVQIATSGTLEGALQEFYSGAKFEFVTLAAFAVVGVVLVVIGIFSVMAYTVALRTNEIGIRMALGAQQTNILHLVLFNGFRLVAAGVLIGLLVSAGLTRFLASQISGVSVTDPWTFAAVVTLVVSVGLFACLLPARRATRIDPLLALRYE
jgi:putative ABC transport system permease protein